MGNLLFRKADSRIPLFKSGGALATVRLARENIKLLKLVQKLVNNILNEQITATPIDENAQASPEAEQTPAKPSHPTSAPEALLHRAADPAATPTPTAPPATTPAQQPPEDKEGGSDAGLHQARAVLINAVKELLAFSRHLTDLVRGDISGKGLLGGEELMAHLEKWLAGNPKRMQNILNLGGWFTKLQDLDPKDVSGFAFREGDDLIKALYEGLMKEPKNDRTLGRILLAINERGGVRFLLERKRDLILLLLRMLEIPQFKAKKKKSNAEIIESIDRLIVALAGAGSIAKYSTIADRVINAADVDVSATKIVNEIVKLLSTSHYQGRAGEAIAAMPENIQAEVTKLLGIQGSPKDIDEKQSEKITASVLAFASSVQQLRNAISAINTAAGASVVEALKKSADPNSRTTIIPELNKLLTDIEDDMKSVRDELADFLSSRGDIYDRLIAIYTDGVEALKKADAAAAGSVVAVRKEVASWGQAQPQKTSSIALFRTAVDTAADPTPKPDEPEQAAATPDPQAAPQATPASAAAPQPVATPQPAQDPQVAAFGTNWTAYTDAAGSLYHALSASVEGQAAAQEPEGAPDEESVPLTLPQLSFKNDEEISGLLKEIKAWFVNNEELIAKVIKSNIMGTGILGTKSKKDMRTIATMAADMKNKATQYIDQLLK